MAEWRKSSLSHANGSCFEVARLTDATVVVRDSEDGDRPIPNFSADEWEPFISEVENGEFDDV